MLSRGSCCRTNRAGATTSPPRPLDAYRAHYGEWVSKNHIFSYVYGILHSPDYRQRYADDLAKLLPRIPEVATADVFRAFSEAGQRLLDLHISYEAAGPYPLEERLKSGAPDEPERYRVQKMRWGGPTRTPDRSVIVYNDWITLAGIPDEAHEYVVGPRSALEMAARPLPGDNGQDERHRQRSERLGSRDG